MPFVIEAKKIQRNGVLRRYFVDCNDGESGWVKKRFEAKSYSTEKKAKQAKNMLGAQTFSKLAGSKSEWKISIKSLAYKITDREMRTLVNECLDSLVKRTGLTRSTIRKKIIELI